MKNKLLLILLPTLAILLMSACNLQSTKVDIESITLNGTPIIESYSFGSITINGKSHGDIKIYENEIKSWKYIKRHTVKIDDIKDITDGIDILVIGTFIFASAIGGTLGLLAVILAFIGGYLLNDIGVILLLIAIILGWFAPDYA